MPIFQETIDDITNTNFKVIAGGPAAGSSIAQHLAQIDAVDRQRLLGVISNAAVAEALLQRAGQDVGEAVATSKLARSDVGEIAAQLNALVAMIQQMMKGAQTTPPAT
jgi:hypothetical protein